jgi:hypothetical protein
MLSCAAAAIANNAIHACLTLPPWSSQKPFLIREAEKEEDVGEACEKDG